MSTRSVIRSESSSPITTTNGNYGKPPVLNGAECCQAAVWWIIVKLIGDMNVIWWHHSRRQGLPLKTKTKKSGNNNGVLELKYATSHKVTFWNIIILLMCLLVVTICTLTPCRRKQERSKNTNTYLNFWSICIKLELTTGSKIMRRM